MAGARRARTIGGIMAATGRSSGRPIPKRGQVKIGIVLCLAHSLASVFSFSGCRASTQFCDFCPKISIVPRDAEDELGVVRGPAQCSAPMFSHRPTDRWAGSEPPNRKFCPVDIFDLEEISDVAD